MFKNISLLSLVFITSSLNAASVVEISKITSLYTYGTYSNNDTRYRNDIVVKIESPPEGCDAGFYVSADDSQNNPTMVSFLLSAFHSKTSVRISGYSDQLWDGSQSSKFCRINNISLMRE